LHSKLVNGTLSLAIGLTILGNGTIPVHAASWHKGTPISVQGKWKTNWHSEEKKMPQERELVTITRKSFNSTDQEKQPDGNTTEDIAAPNAIGASYKYLGNHTYQIKGKELFSGTSVIKVKRYSHNKLKISQRHFKEYLYRR